MALTMSSTFLHAPSFFLIFLSSLVGPAHGSVTQRSIMQESVQQPHEEMMKDFVPQQFQTTSEDMFSEGGWLERKNRKAPAKSYRRKYLFKYYMGDIIKVLRISSVRKPKVHKTSDNVVKNIGSRREETRKKRKRTDISNDEFSKARKHLKYFLQRINYEQNLIDVYCGEGWKRQSVDKIKPEMELQHAKAKIFRFKLRIRDLFNHVDSLCVQGRLPDSLFDAEGRIDSEDIFCAKCGIDDVSDNNDIILCDGVCERGFHQMCLDPPLLNVPDNDEGWLCPGCDCKVDCIDILNESQGTKLTVEDSWENVFPEAASEPAPENCTNHSSGFPSDASSEDDEIDPNASKDDYDDSVKRCRSSSRKPIFSSEPTDLHALEHFSDDSEDDDYKPNDSPVDMQNNNSESSSSDFTSDSEDITAVIKDANEAEDASLECSKLSSGSTRRISKFVGNKNLVNDEQGQGGSSKSDQFLVLPSDDSEDDDYDPNSPQIDEKNNSECSSSDFTSGCDDLTATFEDANKAEDASFKISAGSAQQGSKIVGNKNLPIDGKETIVKSNPAQDESGPISEMKYVEKLHNKKVDDQVFPEAASEPASENCTNHSSGFLSDDSKDNEFNPDASKDDYDGNVKCCRSSSRKRVIHSDPNTDLHVVELLSDDSEDDDYMPNDSQIDVQKNNPESSSSDFTSDSEDISDVIKDANEVEDASLECSKLSSGNKNLLSDAQGQGDSSKNDQFLVLPSDNSEDDDYDPKSPQIDEQNTSKNQSLVFISNCEDLTSAFEGAKKAEDASFKLSAGFARQGSKIVGNMNLQNDGQETMVKSNPAQDDSGPISERKHVEKLHNRQADDVVYENISDSSEDDIEFAEVAPRGKVHKSSAEYSAPHANGKSSVMDNGFSTDCKMEDSKSPNISAEYSAARRTKYSKHVTEELYKHFKENQYPDRLMMESLGKELGLQLKQVSKWFGNARWSFRHRHSVEVSSDAHKKDKSPEGATSSSSPNSKPRKGNSRPKTPHKIPDSPLNSRG